MNDTVMKLMSMVDLLCSACVDDVCAGDQAIPNYESNASTLHAALEAELTRLFTPLTREQVNGILSGSGYDTATAQERADFINGIRHSEIAHGITGEKNEAAWSRHPLLGR